VDVPFKGRPSRRTHLAIFPSFPSTLSPIIYTWRLCPSFWSSRRLVKKVSFPELYLRLRRSSLPGPSEAPGFSDLFLFLLYPRSRSSPFPPMRTLSRPNMGLTVLELNPTKWCKFFPSRAPIFGSGKEALSFSLIMSPNYFSVSPSFPPCC